jgi:hypothetical protein
VSLAQGVVPVSRIFLLVSARAETRTRDRDKRQGDRDKRQGQETGTSDRRAGMTKGRQAGSWASGSNKVQPTGAGAMAMATQHDIESLQREIRDLKEDLREVKSIMSEELQQIKTQLVELTAAATAIKGQSRASASVTGPPGLMPVAKAQASNTMTAVAKAASSTRKLPPLPDDLHVNKDRGDGWGVQPWCYPCSKWSGVGSTHLTCDSHTTKVAWLEENRDECLAFYDSYLPDEYIRQ